MITYNYIAAFFLIVLGFYTIIAKYNLIKTVIGLSIADYGVNLLIISIGYNPGGTAPIFTQGELTAASYFV
ncbi:MAG: NADH-quinone oxidoreductase subunit K, partial [Oscillospiraceae bacterium]|nr:NADH-quinone oxidoreductase subunit K [Oscillospiraceae bacterium]